MDGEPEVEMEGLRSVESVEEDGVVSDGLWPEVENEVEVEDSGVKG